MNSAQNRNDHKDFLVRDTPKPVNFYCAAPHAKSVAIMGDCIIGSPSQ